MQHRKTLQPHQTAVLALFRRGYRLINQWNPHILWNIRIMVCKFFHHDFVIKLCSTSDIFSPTPLRNAIELSSNEKLAFGKVSTSIKCEEHERSLWAHSCHETNSTSDITNSQPRSPQNQLHIMLESPFGVSSFEVAHWQSPHQQSERQSFPVHAIQETICE